MFSANSNIKERAYRALVVALVLGLVAQASVGTAVAASSTNTTTDDDCDTWYGGYYTQQYNDVCLDDNTDSDLEQYAIGASLGSQSEAYIISHKNAIQDSRAVVWNKALITLVNEFNNGSNKSVAKAAMNETIADYYAHRQLNIINHYNASIAQLEYIANTSESPTEITLTNESGNWTESYVIDGDAETDVPTVVHGDYNGARLANESYDGSDPDTGRPYEALALDNPANSPLIKEPFPSQFEGTGTTPPIDNDLMVYVNRSTENGTERQIALDVGSYGETFRLMNVQSKQMKANVDEYVEGVYANYEPGELNVTDIASPTAIAAEASTNYNSTGYYSFASIQLASLGLSGDANTSVVIEVPAENGTIYSGSIYYTGEDLTTFENGTRYNLSDYNGTFVLARAGENITKANATMTIREDFRVTSLTNAKTGESVNNTTMEVKVYESYNSSELETVLQKLQELQEEEDEAYNRSQTINVETPGFDWSSLGTGGLIGGGAALLVLGFLAVQILGN